MTKQHYALDLYYLGKDTLPITYYINAENKEQAFRHCQKNKNIMDDVIKFSVANGMYNCDTCIREQIEKIRIKPYLDFSDALPFEEKNKIYFIGCSFSGYKIHSDVQLTICVSFRNTKEISDFENNEIIKKKETNYINNFETSKKKFSNRDLTGYIEYKVFRVINNSKNIISFDINNPPYKSGNEFISIIRDVKKTIK